jgi:hypothetical protein
MWDYTVHVVGSQEQYRELLPRYPRPSSDLILIMQPGEEPMRRFRTELDAQRAAASLPPARINDLRPRP